MRFRRLLRNIWWVDGPIHGVIRAAALSQTRAIHPRHMSGDQILLTELSLKGRFYEIPDERFFSRVHPNKTSRQQKTLRDRAALVDQMDPGTRGTRLVAHASRLSTADRHIHAMHRWSAALTMAKKPLSVRGAPRGGVLGVLRVRQVATGTSPWSRGSDP